ncbi:MAG TPA: alanine--tRNA ligase [Anaerolineae bacterium]|nr:alanine--tRNA ligase [Anaerolineae bacterium]
MSSAKRSRKAAKPTSDEIRQAYLDFFAARGHTIVHAASLVPGDDPTLLFTNAGMVQFKDVFLGTGSRPYTRVADSQKCLRVAGKHNDLDDVGRDDTHHTFFEMLGNWSFGDYYKAEAIAWAWELLTEVWKLPKERFWATCFEDEKGEIPRDDEAAGIWAEQPGFDPEHILFFGREENFWEMADTGPCGPDSEIHFDQGPDFCDMQDVPGHVCRVNGDCARYLELWNLVFIQYNRLDETHLELLPAKHVDTGMGFERLVSLLQGVRSNYETDLFTPLLDRIQELGGHSNEERQALLTPYRVIADHARAAAFLIADGVVPGNTGRNYVCRMIIRRASRFGNHAGFEESFLAKIAEVVIGRYGEAYPELARHRTAILSTITDEERRFHRTLEAGIAHLAHTLDQIRAAGGKTVPGPQAFDLYATYGLPLEITRDIAREQEMDVDEEGFQDAMETHRLVSGVGLEQEEALEGDVETYRQLLHDLRQTDRLGDEGVVNDPYGSFSSRGPVLALLVDGKSVKQVQSGDGVAVVLPETGFYVEAGGQVADTGSIISEGKPGWEIRVEGVRQPIGRLILHVGKVIQGKPRVSDAAVAQVDGERRWDIMRNHTATHLLHAGLRKVLGDHARQAGSLVAPDRLRFDFTHPQALKPEEIRRIEAEVNQAILANYDLDIRLQPHEEAVNDGAIALFGETYGDMVRTIAIGDEERLSFELCGGTHVPSTGVIGPFIIVSEGSVAAGIRRIEALTGRGALELIQRRLQSLDRLAGMLQTSSDQLETRIEALLEDRTRLAADAAEMHKHQAALDFNKLEPKEIDGVKILKGLISDADADTLRSLIDRFRVEHPSGVVVLGTIQEDRPLIVAGVSSDLVKRGLHAGALVKAIAAEVGGSGGGKPTLAQAGGKDPNRLAEALEQVHAWVRSHLS